MMFHHLYPFSPSLNTDLAIKFGVLQGKPKVPQRTGQGGAIFRGRRQGQKRSGEQGVASPKFFGSDKHGVESATTMTIYI
jgi:hypothetical protein